MFDIFNVEKISKKINDKLFIKMKIDDDKNISDKMKKVLRWLGEKLPPILSNLFVAIATFYIFNLLYKSYGIDYIIIIGVVAMIFSMTAINKSLKKLTS